MIRLLLFVLFFALLSADTLGLNRGLAPGISIKNAFLYLILIIIGLETAVARNRRIELLPVLVPYSLYFLYAAVTIAMIVLFIQYPTYRPISSVIGLKGGIADHLVVLVAYFYGILVARDAISLWKLIIWTVIVANLITVVDSLNIPNLGLVGEREDGRIGGPIGEANQYAAFIALFLPGIVALALFEDGVRRWLAWVGIATTVLALVMTASRGGLVGIFGGSLLAALILRRYISGRAVVIALGSGAIMGVLATIIAIVAGYGDLLYERIVGLSTAGNKFDVSSGRTVIWGRALGKMLDQPVTLITGFGWDAYRQFRDFSFAPHNSYLKIFFETGIIGLGLVFFAIGNIYRTALKALPRANGEARAILIAFIFGLSGILTAIFFVDIFNAWLFTWAYIGIAMRLAVELRKNGRSEGVSPSGPKNSLAGAW